MATNHSENHSRNTSILGGVANAINELEVVKAVKESNAVKAVSELFSPLAGEVTEVNARLNDEPALVNSDPFGDGWMIKLKVADKAARASLMSADAYKSLLGE